MDFTLTTYSRLLKALQNSGYSFQTFLDFIQNPKSKTVILRHDVDRLPGNALKMARLEKRVVREFTRIGANEEGNISAVNHSGNGFIACGRARCQGMFHHACTKRVPV